MGSNSIPKARRQHVLYSDLAQLLPRIISGHNALDRELAAAANNSRVGIDTNQLSNKIAQKGLALLRQRSVTTAVIASE